MEEVHWESSNCFVTFNGDHTTAIRQVNPVIHLPFDSTSGVDLGYLTIDFMIHVLQLPKDTIPVNCFYSHHKLICTSVSFDHSTFLIH